MAGNVGGEGVRQGLDDGLGAQVGAADADADDVVVVLSQVGRGSLDVIQLFCRDGRGELDPAQEVRAGARAVVDFCHGPLCGGTQRGVFFGAREVDGVVDVQLECLHFLFMCVFYL